MKLKQTTFESRVMGAEKEEAFTIDSDNSVIFDILRNKMYSDKIGAVCREVSCNSRDANREAGHGDVPVKIRIYEPNSFVSMSDMSISFEDCGIGITPTRMSDIFLKYGASTKRDTNSQTGGFGLGAKTPFAYSDTFMVITVCDVDGVRMSYTYTAMIDTSRKGKMILFDSEETTEETGTKVIVPISSNDRYEFETKCIASSCLWETLPEYLGFRNKKAPLEWAMKEETYSLVYDSDNLLGEDNSFIALVDGVPYPVSRRESEINLRSVGNNNAIVIEFDNGELTVAANRELLQYDEETIEALKIRFKGIRDNLITKVSAYLSDDKLTYIQMAVRIETIKAAANRGSVENIEDTYMKTIVGLWSWISRDIITKKNGIQLTSNLSWKFHKAYRVCKNEYDGYGRKEELSINEMTGFTDRWSDGVVYFRDTSNRDTKRFATLLEEHENFILIEPIKGFTMQARYQEAYKMVFKQDVNFKMFSDVAQKQLTEEEKAADATPGMACTFRRIS